jgi:hypothetical protein
MRSIEVLLYGLNLVVWLGPLFLSAWRRTVSLIHPSAYFPIYLIFTVSVAMTEHWFNWSNRSLTPGIRHETRIYQDLPGFYSIPLLILILVGIAYHAGVHKGCGRAVAGKIDRIHLMERFRSVRGTRNSLSFVAIILSVICIVPFALLGQESGFFWTLGLLYAFALIPILMMSQWKLLGYLMWFLGLPAMFLLDSKGNFIYYVLPLVLFYQGTLFYKGKKFQPFKILILIGILTIVSLGTKYLTIRRGEYLEDLPLIYNIAVREYGFEIFAILVKKISWVGQFFKESWIFLELTEIIPSAILPFEKVRAGVKVAYVFLPYDYNPRWNVGFNRFFVFAAYHDFGLFGAIIFSFFFGWLLGRIYRSALKQTYNKKVLWPLVAWLPVPLYAQYTSIGNIPFFLIFSGFGVLIVYLFSVFSRLRVS